MSEGSDGALDVRERGAPIDGQPQTLDTRLYMQLLVLEVRAGNLPDAALRALTQGLDGAEANAVVYQDVNHPLRYGLLTWSESPRDFVTRTRVAVEGAAERLAVIPEMTMVGRTYSSGYEPDLAYWLLRRPAETVRNEAWPWAIWYPLRRKGSFEALEGRDKGGILREHAEIGKRYGQADLAHDVRLACHGLDTQDNDFVIGLIGKDLHPLSHVVQRMRQTRQTREFLERLGPFFVGHVTWRSRPRD